MSFKRNFRKKNAPHLKDHTFASGEPEDSVCCSDHSMINREVPGVVPPQCLRIPDKDVYRKFSDMTFGELKEIMKANRIDMSIFEDLFSDDTKYNDLINLIEDAVTKIRNDRSSKSVEPRIRNDQSSESAEPSKRIRRYKKTKLSENSYNVETVDKNYILNIISVVIASISMAFTIKAALPANPGTSIVLIKDQTENDLLERMVTIAEEQSESIGRRTDATELQLIRLKEMLELLRELYETPPGVVKDIPDEVPPID